MDVEAIQRLFVEAMASDTFTRHGSRSGTWNLAQGCEEPVPVTLHSRATGLAKNITPRKWKPIPMIELVLLTRCRHCGWCLKRKSWEWATRAETEIERAQRTWFGTLTFRPDEHIRLEYVAMTKIGNFASLAPRKKFELLTNETGREVTLFFKRLRKNNPLCHIRYLAVTEIHNSDRTSPEMRGRPHIHLLVHEFPGQLLTKRALEAEWSLGFQNWKLADKGAGWYVSKYVSKASEARVRASLRYGK